MGTNTKENLTLKIREVEEKIKTIKQFRPRTDLEQHRKDDDLQILDLEIKTLTAKKEAKIKKYDTELAAINEKIKRTTGDEQKKRLMKEKRLLFKHRQFGGSEEEW